jgi:YebC/PmpR family DNA-binding regulatory protein
MSGHSKWAQIKRKKEISDQKKGQIFSKLSNKITIAAKSGMDPSVNYKLQSAIEEARAANMPKENIERAIKRAAEKEAASLVEVVIQAIGPASLAIVIKAVTNNKNRTMAEVKNILTKNGFKVVPENSLNWMFNPDWSPKNPLEVNDPSINQKFSQLLEELVTKDDIENVYSNLK